MIRLKNKDDINGIRKSCKVLAELFALLSSEVVEGISGLDLDRLWSEKIKARGAKAAFLNYQGFPNSVCISVNNAVIHGIPNSKPFKAGDIVSVDCGLIINSYVSDMAFTYPIGIVKQEITNLLHCTQESLYKGIEAAQEGGRIHDISRAVFQHTKPKGYGVVKPYCGHGVGFDVHEDPQVPNYVGGGPNPRLKSGMVIAIEPMINLGSDDVYELNDGWTVVTRDGKPSAHFEHTIAIFEGQTEILTKL